MIDKVMIAGKMGAGKDSVADYLVEKYGFVKISFAEPIYWIARNIFFMRKKNRRLLQVIGQTARIFWKDIWVYLTFRKAKKLLSQGKKVVISDVRQRNEYIKGITHGFFPIRVVADEEIRKNRIVNRDGIVPDMSRQNHKAETGADECRMTQIYNECTLDDLYQEVDKLLKKGYL